MAAQGLGGGPTISHPYGGRVKPLGAMGDALDGRLLAVEMTMPISRKNSSKPDGLNVTHTRARLR